VASRFGEHPHNPIKIELHSTVAEPFPVRVVDVTPLLWRSAKSETRLTLPIALYTDTLGLALHAITHAAKHMWLRTLRFTSLYDLFLLLRRCDEAAWQMLLAGLTEARCLWLAYPVLALLNRYFPNCVPANVCAQTRAATLLGLRRWVDGWPARAATLSAVSLCNIAAHAWHQRLSWMRPTDLVAYAKQVLLIDATDKQEWLDHQATKPDGMRFAASRWQRVLRWLNPNATRMEF
jgi:hypothetical protein